MTEILQKKRHRKGVSVGRGPDDEIRTRWKAIHLNPRPWRVILIDGMAERNAAQAQHSSARVPVSASGLSSSPRRCDRSGGFSLHAAVHLHANDREGLAHLCATAPGLRL